MSFCCNLKVFERLVLTVLIAEYRISGIFPQLLTFALEIFGKANFREQAIFSFIFISFFIVNDMIY